MPERIDDYMTHLDDLVKRYPGLEVIKSRIESSYLMMRETYKGGGKILTAGNGGSAADAEHIVGELMKGFELERSVSAGFSASLREVDGKRGALLAENLQGTLRAVALTSHEALSTAYMNDKAASCVYAQQLFGYGKKGDVFFGDFHLRQQ